MIAPIAGPHLHDLRVLLMCLDGSLLDGGGCAGVGGNWLLITGSGVPVLRRINCAVDIDAAS